MLHRTEQLVWGNLGLNLDCRHIRRSPSIVAAAMWQPCDTHTTTSVKLVIGEGGQQHRVGVTHGDINAEEVREEALLLVTVCTPQCKAWNTQASMTMIKQQATRNSSYSPTRASPHLPGIGLRRRSRPQRPAAVDVKDLIQLRHRRIVKV